MRQDIGVFYASDDGEESMAIGLNLAIKISEDEERKVILLEKNHCCDSSIESIVATLIHEWDHFRTGVSDGDSVGRMFRSLADERIGELICRLWEQLTGESVEQ
jgi:hypothetical protein